MGKAGTYELALAMLILAILMPGKGLLMADSPRILETIELPEAALVGTMSLEEALAKRSSQRSFNRDLLLSLSEIGQLFWAAQGVNRMQGQIAKRTAPSAGALYPLEIYAVTRKGLYHYRPEGHGALTAWHGALLDSLWLAAGANKDAIRQAAAVFVITGNIGRTEPRYGARALRYVTLEAGHAAQNLLLQAVALGLGAMPIGAYDDARVADCLKLPAEETPLYLIPVGRAP